MIEEALSFHGAQRLVAFDAEIRNFKFDPALTFDRLLLEELLVKNCSVLRAFGSTHGSWGGFAKGEHVHSGGR